jgi:hypothetical protein
MDSSTRRLADLACALRQLDQCPDPEDEEGFTQTSLKPLTEIEKTQQDLLDGLAFLVPTEKTAEQVAAVGMEEDRDNRMLRFFVAMNGTVPEQNVEAIQQIIYLIRNSQSGKHSLHSLVIQWSDIHLDCAHSCRLRINIRKYPSN